MELAEQTGRIFADLRIGSDVAGAMPLKSNDDLCCPGVKLHGAGFIVTPEQAKALGLGRVTGLEQHIRPYLNGRDLTGSSRNVMVIDLFGLTCEQVQRQFPEVYQWIYDLVKPERDQNRSVPTAKSGGFSGSLDRRFVPHSRGFVAISPR